MASRDENVIAKITQGAVAVAGPVTAGALGLLAAVRRRRAFHPTGEAFTGTWTAADDSLPPLLPSRPWPVVVRLSKGVGLPGELPDVLGLAIRIVDLQAPGDHQDLLLASSGSSRTTRRLLAPTTDHGGTHYSTITPYRTPLGEGVLWAQATLEGDAEPPRSVTAAGDRALDGRLHYDIGVEVDDVLHLLGTVRLHERLDDEVAEALRFDPHHPGAGLEPAGPFDGIRRQAYAASRWARGAPSETVEEAVTEEAVEQEAVGSA